MEIDEEDAGKSALGADRCVPFLYIRGESWEHVLHKISPPYGKTGQIGSIQVLNLPCSLLFLPLFA